MLVFEPGVVLTDQTRRANGGLWFKNFVEFSECLELLLDSPTVSDALAKSGRAFTIANYSAEVVTSRMLALLA